MQRLSKTIKGLAWLAAGLAVALPASTATYAAQPRIHAGEPVAVGEGTARTIVAVGDDAAPTSVSVVLTASALEGLPEVTSAQAVWEYLLPMPSTAPETGYTHIGLDWNPAGHHPEGIYSVAHFDVHFYLVTPDERQRITFFGKDAARAMAPPPQALLPAGYVVPPEGAVEGMGMHGANLASAEFHGRPFTHTFIYGYYAGRLIFLEPMVSLEYLQSKADVTIPIVTPRAYSLAGHYPSRYRVGFDADRGEYRIVLTGLKPYAPERQALAF